MIALKVQELGQPQSARTKLTVFDEHGTILTEPPFIDVQDCKYEGIEFLIEHENW